MISVKEKENKAFEAMKGKFGYTNKMEAPRLVKIAISTGIGSVKDKKKIELIGDRLKKITGQNPVVKAAKKSIAGFKMREGDPVGYQVTLRGSRMYDFLDRLLNIALPRTRDFRGISPKALDDMGNYTLGIREHTIFAETTDEDLKDVFGIGVTLVTTSHNKDETRTFLELLGFPFKKEEKTKR